MTDLPWTARNVADELAGAVTSAASYAAHRSDQADALRAAVVERLDEQGREYIRSLDAALSRVVYQEMLAEMTADELHARRLHPGFEYATTEGPRKQWDHSDVPPEGEGWVRNRHTGRDGWERFDYTEESYWMRPTSR